MSDNKTTPSFDFGDNSTSPEGPTHPVHTIHPDTPMATGDAGYGENDAYHEATARLDGYFRNERHRGAGRERVVRDPWATVKGMTREELLARLDERVNGQDNAKQALIKAIKVSAFRACCSHEGNVSDLRPLSVLLVGPTGCGKSEIVSALADAIGARVVNIDGSRLTGEGWKGQSMSALMSQVEDIQKKTPGELVIVFVDEFDKMVKVDEREPSFDPQSSLFTLLDGTDTVLMDKNEKIHRVDLDGVQVIFGGAFQDIWPIVSRRVGDGRDADWGFGQEREGGVEEALQADCDIEPSDLVEYGVMPELVGRMGTIVTMHGLSSEVIRSLVKGTSASAEARFSRILPEGCTFDISDAAADHITSLVVERRLGARGIDQVLADAYGEAVIGMTEDPTVTGAVVELSGEELVVRFDHGSRVA